MKDLSKSYREINIILDLLGDEFNNKIPKSMKNFFLKNEDKNYNPKITLEDVFNQNILPETSSLVAILYINYWTENSVEKDKYMNIIKEHDEEKRKKLFNIFDGPKSQINNENTIDEKQIITNIDKPKFKEKISEILEKFKNLFNKKK